MPFSPHTNKNRWLVALVLLMAVPLVTVAHDDADAPREVADARDAFDQLWHQAAETGKRRAELMQTVALFDTKVANAKRDLQALVDQRKSVRSQIDTKRLLVQTMLDQLSATQELRAYYQTLALSRDDDTEALVRFVASREIAQDDAGPVAGGWLLKFMLRPSLGDTVQDQIGQSALVGARERFILKLNALLAETQKTEDHQKDVLGDLQNELKALEDQNRAIGDTAEKKAQVIDASWRQKKLSEAELKDVADEVAESNAAIAAAQRSLAQINAQLRERTQEKLRSEQQKILNEIRDLTQQKDELSRGDDSVQALSDASLKAYQTAMTLRNSDPKLYKRIGERELELKNAKDDLASSVKDREDGLGTRPLTDGEVAALRQTIQILSEQIALMKTGVPDEPAASYVRAKRAADAAAAESGKRAEKRTEIQAQIADLTKQSSILAEKLGAAEADAAMPDLPVVFVWPVRGSITAGYYDTEYQAVFGVPHRAIDITAAQGSPVSAITDGVVLAVHDGGARGFSYVLLGHRNGYTSLYGHVSRFLVSKGDVVYAGQPIALSGGLPGTHGAGPMTTGAHVHLEVTKDGKHVNPLSVLP